MTTTRLIWARAARGQSTGPMRRRRDSSPGSWVQEAPTTGMPFGLQRIHVYASVQTRSLTERRAIRPSRAAMNAILMSSSRYTPANRSTNSAVHVPHPTRPRGFGSTSVDYSTHGRTMATLAILQLAISSTGTAGDGTSSSSIDGMVTPRQQSQWSPERPHPPTRITEGQRMARMRIRQHLNPPIPQLPSIFLRQIPRC